MFKILIASLAFTACGSKHTIQGGTEHYTETTGEVEVRVILTVDITPCHDLPSSEKLECIRAMLDTFKQMGDLSKLIQVQQGAQE